MYARTGRSIVLMLHLTLCGPAKFNTGKPVPRDHGQLLFSGEVLSKLNFAIIIIGHEELSYEK